MAVVMQQEFMQGYTHVVCRFHDTALVGVSDEEIQRRIDNMNAIARQIFIDADLRKLAEQAEQQKSG